MHEPAGAGLPLSILERAAIEELDHTPHELSRLERLLIAAIVEIGRLGGTGSHPEATLQPVDGLTPREQEVLRLVVEGHTNKSAGAILGISARTVEIHRLRVQKKLGVRSSAELVRVVTGGGPSGEPPTARQLR